MSILEYKNKKAAINAAFQYKIKRVTI